jgi:hypothetical protein
MSRPVCTGGPNQTGEAFQRLLPSDGDPIRADSLEPRQLTEEERLQSLTQMRLGNRIRNLRVQRQPGGLVLQGRTTTYHVKQLVQHAVMEMATTAILANNIEVLTLCSAQASAAYVY